MRARAFVFAPACVCVYVCVCARECACVRACVHFWSVLYGRAIAAHFCKYCIYVYVFTQYACERESHVVLSIRMKNEEKRLLELKEKCERPRACAYCFPVRAHARVRALARVVLTR